jgi:hypothetical protein
MAMVRKQIYLPLTLDRKLKAAAKRQRTSEAAVIRETLEDRFAHDSAIEREARDQFLAMLRRVREEAMKYPGTGWKFNREDLYEERIERQMPR